VPLPHTAVLGTCICSRTGDAFILRCLPALGEKTSDFAPPNSWTATKQNTTTQRQHLHPPIMDPSHQQSMNLPVIDLDVYLNKPRDSIEVQQECAKAANALITYGALVLHDSRVADKDNDTFLDLLEDYWLWKRMMLGGARMGNLPEVLVDYRVDEALFARRGGWRLFSSDVRLQRRMLLDRVTTPGGFLRNLAVRATYRFAPGWARRIGYRRFVERSDRSAGAA